MNDAMIAQLAIALAPVAQQLIIEGGKLIIEMKKEMTTDEMIKALEASRSTAWPQLDFKPEASA